MTKAAPSGKTYEKTTFSCGLFSVPVDVYSATANDAGVKHKWFTTDNHEVGLITVDKATDKPYPRDQIQTKIATEHGFVYVEDHEIEALFSILPHTITVQSIQPRGLLDTTYIRRTPFFVQPGKIAAGKKKVENATAAKVLTLLFQMLRDKDAVAFVEFVARGVPKPAVLLPDGSLWLLYFEEELREQRPITEAPVAPQEVAMFAQLVQALWRDEPEDLSDHRSAAIQALADEKAAAGDFAKPEEPALAAVPDAAPDDFMALLQASVAAVQAA